MEEAAAHDAGSAIAASAIDAYLAANPYDAAKGLEQINTQYWVSSFLNGPEAFANFRRSGFPALAPNPFPGKAIKGNFINRLTYPNSEICQALAPRLRAACSWSMPIRKGRLFLFED